jgi:hypothetical protein
VIREGKREKEYITGGKVYFSKLKVKIYGIAKDMDGNR